MLTSGDYTCSAAEGDAFAIRRLHPEGVVNIRRLHLLSGGAGVVTIWRLLPEAVVHIGDHTCSAVAVRRLHPEGVVQIWRLHLLSGGEDVVAIW